MPTLIYKFKNKQWLNETVGHLAACGFANDVKDVSFTNEFRISVSCKDNNEIIKLQSIMNAIKESAWFENTTTRVIKLLAEAANGNGKMIRLINGDLVRLTPVNARALIFVHDRLSEDNQIALRTMLIESKETHEAAVQFCLDNLKETE
jgi:hypothetical protein